MFKWHLFHPAEESKERVELQLRQQLNESYKYNVKERRTTKGKN